MFELHVRFQIAAFLIWCLIAIDYNRNPKLKLLSTKCFRMSLLLSGMNLVLDMASVYTITHINEIPQWTNRLVHQLFIGSVICILFCNYLYVEILANEQKRLNSKKLVIAMIPLAAALVMICQGSLSYHLQGSDAYSYGNMAYSVYGCSVLYLLLCFSVTRSASTSLSRYQKGSIELGLIIWLGIMAFQMVCPYVLLSGIGSILLLLSIYFSFENQKENFDSQTECFNLNAFQRMVTEYWEKGKKPFLVSVSCSDFQRFYDLAGYDQGMEALRRIRWILSKYIPNEIYHSQAETFSVFCSSRPETEILHALAAELEETRFWGIQIHYCIGVLDLETYARKKDDVYEFLRVVAKERKGMENRIIYLNQDMADRKWRRDRIEQLVTEALAGDGFEMYYQPIYSTRRKRFCSAEALLRLKNCGELGFVSPEEFILIMEEKGMIVELGDRVFELVARDISQCRIRELGMDYVEVNLSRLQTVTPDIAEHLRRIVEPYGVEPGFLNVEITETAAVSSEEILAENILQLKEAGFGLSMDDFGTGYSNLAQINRIRYDLIKLDKSMIWPAFDHEAKDAARRSARKLLEASIAMLKAMEVSIVAEGVETKEMVDFLTACDVDYLQGYYYSRPVAREAFVRFLEENRQG